MTYSILGNNIRNLRDYLEREERISFQDFENILKDAQDIFERCLPLDENGAIKGLIYGHVQSGKTAIILTTMALAADNGYKNFIVLTSNINDLYDQTLGRIKKSLDGFTVLGKKDFQRYTGFDVDAVRVLVSSKHGKTLEKVRNLAQKLGWQNQSTFIIDDEADQASLNTNINKPDKGVSTINHQIRSIRQELGSCTYLQTTATPQALLLQDRSSDFRPDFVVATTPGTGYIGGNHYFINDDDTNKPSPHIRIVPTVDPDNLRSSNRLPDAISLSIVTFFLGSAVLRLRGNTKKYTYLLHTSFKQADHSVMFRLVDEFRNQLMVELTLAERNSLDQVSIIFRNFLNSAYQDLTGTFDEIPTLEAIIKEVVDKVASTELIEANSSTKLGVKPEPDRQHTLYIGGTKMSRGVTFKNLLVTYYGRDSQTPQIDTVLQHARMYGYRSAELPAIRIYLPQNLSNRFSDIHTSDNIMREKCRLTHETIPVIPLMSRNLRPTRRNVLNDLTVMGTYYGGVEYFPRIPVSDPDLLKNQTEIIDNYLFSYDDRVAYEITIDQIFYILSSNFSFAAPESTGGWKDELICEALAALKDMPEYGNKASLVIYNRNAAIRKSSLSDYKLVRAVLPQRKAGTILTSLPSDRPALILTKNDGKEDFTPEGINKGWNDHPFWIPVVRFPEGNYAFSVNYS